MCTLIAAVLPESANFEAVASIFDKHKVGFKVVEAPHALAELAPRDVVIQTTRAMCDCGTPLGSQSGNRTSHPARPNNPVDKLRKKGWSETKIARWQQQKEQEKQKEQRVQSVHAENALPHLDYWIRFISNVLHSGHTLRIGLLLVWGTVQYDHHRTLRQERVKLSDLTAEHLLHMEENVVYNYYC